MRRRRRPRRHNTRRAVEIFVTRLTGRPTETPPRHQYQTEPAAGAWARTLPAAPRSGAARDRRRDGPGRGGTCGRRRPVDSGAMRDLWWLRYQLHVHITVLACVRFALDLSSGRASLAVVFRRHQTRDSFDAQIRRVAAPRYVQSHALISLRQSSDYRLAKIWRYFDSMSRKIFFLAVCLVLS